VQLELPLHDETTAPEGSRKPLEATKDKLGFLPNVLRLLSNSPALLKSYQTLTQQFETTSLTPTERHVVLLTASRENGCTYCVAAHSVIAANAGAPEEVIEAIRERRPIADPKLEALSRFTVSMVEARGWIDDADLRSFLDAGYDRQQVLDVLVGIGMKTLSNYANHLQHTPLDDAFADRAYEEAASIPGGAARRQGRAEGRT
jgi:uncharacterized peroxidase-related enzyme